MINVNSLYIRIKDLSQKNRAGYFSVDEYNRHLQDALNLLFEYYAEDFEKTGNIIDNLQPFIKKTDPPLTITNSYCPFPADYRHFLALAYRNVVNSEDCGENPTIDEIGMDYRATDEWDDAKNSPIRKPDITKRIVAYRFINGQIETSQERGTVAMTYLSKPSGAVMGFTVDSGKPEEIYDPNTSVQIPFLEQDETNLTDIILFLLGIQIRETALIQYVSQKRQLFK